MFELIVMAALALQQRPPVPILPNTWFGLRLVSSSNQENVTIVRLVIDATGRVVDCATVQTSKFPGHDAQACLILKHKARFEPARDQGGNPIDATVVLALAPTPLTPAPPDAAARFAGWLTSDDYPVEALRANEQGSVLIGWEISERGLVENCEVIQSSLSASLDAASCALVTTRGRYSPALDQRGNPIRSSVARRIIWALP